MPLFDKSTFLTARTQRRFGKTRPLISPGFVWNGATAPVQTSVLPYFVEDSIDQRIVVPGESDLIIESPSRGLVITCCHESDIHVDGENEETMRQFMSAEPFRKIKFYSREELTVLYPDRKT